MRHIKYQFNYTGNRFPEKAGAVFVIDIFFQLL